MGENAGDDEGDYDDDDAWLLLEEKPRRIGDTGSLSLALFLVSPRLCSCALKWPSWILVKRGGRYQSLRNLSGRFGCVRSRRGNACAVSECTLCWPSRQLMSLLVGMERGVFQSRRE